MVLLFQAIILLLLYGVGQCHTCTNKSVTLNCTSEKSTVKCHEEASCLKIHWSEMMPYSYLGEENSTAPQGILIGVVKELLNRCCESCWSMQETSPVNSSNFYETEPEDAGLSLPYLRSANDRTYLAKYIAIIKDPTSAYVKKKEGLKVVMQNLLSTIYDAWPVLVTALLFSWISGMLIWVMEMWVNDEEFPKKFLTGSWEGFWWAFVSMTTVGYGDRAPRTPLGRVFAICWIMIGICICSIFTATLTSALTMNNFEAQKTITRAKVGVRRGSVEAITALQNQADISYYDTTEEVLNAARSGEVDGILLDYFYTLVTEKSLDKDDLQVVNVFKPKDWSLGVDLLSDDLAKCMTDEYYHHYAEILNQAIINESISEPIRTESSSQISGIFDPTGQVFQLILTISAGGAFFLFLAGLCWDFLRRGNKIESKSEFENMEKEFIAELHTVFINWKERMETNSFALKTSESKA